MNDLWDLTAGQQQKLRELTSFAPTNIDGNIYFTKAEFDQLNIRQKGILDAILIDPAISEEVYDERRPIINEDPDRLIEPKENQFIEVFLTDGAFRFIDHLKRINEKQEPSLPRA